MPGDPVSVRGARQLVIAAVTTWGLGALADPGALVVSELATNAVLHAGRRDVRVTVARVAPQRVRVAIIDKSRVRPVRCTGPATGDPGRGLDVVAALSDRWGVELWRWGKRVWAELSIKSAEDTQ